MALGAVAFAGPARAVEPTVIGFDPEMVHHDADGSAYLSVRDSSGIFDAMERGDEPALLTIKAQLEAESPGRPSLVQTIIAGLCDVAIARVHGDLDTADTILDRLSRSLGPLGSPERSINPLGFMIDLTRSGNQLLRGDVRRWAGTQEQLQRQYFEPLRAAYHMPGLIIRNADLIRLVVPAASIPEQTVVLSPSDVVPFTRWSPIIGGKQVIDSIGEIVIDGDRLPAVFDTNSFLGTLPKSYVTAHRLRVVAQSGAMSDGSGRTMLQSLVLVPFITIGHTVFTNQLFAVAMVERPILGLQLLAHLRHVTMNAKGLSFGSSVPFQCSQPLTISSLRGGYQASLLLPVSLDGQTMMAAFGSGDDTPEAMTIRTTMLPTGPSIHLIDENIETILGRSRVKIALEHADLAIGEARMADMVKYVLATKAMIPNISTHAFRYGTLHFDWAAHRACFD